MVKELVEDILQLLDKKDEVNSLDLIKVFKEDHQKIIGAIKSLETLDNVIEAEQVNKKQWELTKEGQHVVENGSHEASVYNFVPDEGVPQAEVMEKVAYAKVGFSKALAAGWIKLDKSSGKPIVFKNVPSIIDTTRNNLMSFYNLSDSLKVEYKKRKLLQETVIKSVTIKKGANFVTKIVKQDADLTQDLLVNSAWKERSFKPYNFNAMGSALDVGHLHPLLKVRSEFRKIFLEMGFTEMPTNNFVESSFWNFDALFQPQQHPARDAHDTFFISRPKFSTDFPEDYLEKVKQVHSKGGYGSEGYRYDWKLEEAQKNLLRTHTTAVSARMLYKLMREGEFKPVRYFSIDRVFRNETLDATHLAEFHQVEGVIADYNLTLGDLIGTLYEFFKKLGIDKLEFKPAYNPYTEPSMEIFCYHEGLEKWIEIGNSGVFRPEMLLPMGLPEKVNVIAWGLSLERPTMIKYKLNNIRDLVGSKMDLQMVYNNPICRLEKMRKNYPNETIQNANVIMESTKKQSNMKKLNLSIFCDPEYPILWFESMILLLKQCYSILIVIYNHSTLDKLPKSLENFCYSLNNNENNDNVDITVHFIWKNVGIDPVLINSRMEEIFGAINIARFFNRLIESVNSSLLIYESNGELYANIIDSILEKIHISIHSKKTINFKSEFNHLIQLNANKKSMSIIDVITMNNSL